MAHHLGHQHHLDGGAIERQVGVSRPQRGERPDHAQPEGDVGFEQVVHEQARAKLAGEELPAPEPAEPTPSDVPHVHQTWARSADEMGLG